MDRNSELARVRAAMVVAAGRVKTASNLDELEKALNFLEGLCRAAISSDEHPERMWDERLFMDWTSDDLFEQALRFSGVDIGALPTFGGDEPRGRGDGTPYSWDETRFLYLVVGTTDDGWKIVSRPSDDE